MTSPLARLRLDPYILALLAAVAVASVLPVRAAAAVALDHVVTVTIALLFFLYGARLSPQVALAGLRNWRLHTAALATTFVIFPLLGLATRPLVGTLLTEQLYLGVIFLCTLPSTVQSSIAFVSMARGNVAAAFCNASFSNLIGVLVTPLLAGLLIHTNGGFSLSSIRDILLQLLAPFAVGQLARRWVGEWVTRRKALLSLFERGSIVLVVYSAFSAGVVAGIWHQLTAANLAGLLVVDLLLLAAVLAVTTVGSRRLGFPPEDRVAIVFCGSTKSLASGVPIATVLFAGQSVGLMVLPLMLFHQMQLMACAYLARRAAP